MAITTMHTYLMYGEGNGDNITWKKLHDIKDYPDLIESPEQVEITTLSDTEHTYAPGLKTNSVKQFNSNYDTDAFDTIEAMADKEMPLAVWFGAASDGVTPDGHEGKIEGRGKVSAGISSGGVGDANNMTITCTMSKGFKKVKNSALGS